MTIPKIVNPLILRQSSPEALYLDFSRTAMSSVEDITKFTNLLEDSRSQAIFNRAKKVRAENSEGTFTGWMVTEHQDWLDVRKEASPQDSAEEKYEDATQINGLNEEDYVAALRKLGESHTGLETSFLNKGSNIMEVTRFKSYFFNPGTDCLRRSIYLPPQTCVSESSRRTILIIKRLIL